VRVQVTHDFFEAFGGAERVTAEIAAAFPDAEVTAILGRESVAKRMGIDGRVRTLLPSHRPLLAHYRALAPTYPALVRRSQLPAADIVIASSYAYAHGFRTRNNAPVLCYCHSPFRHLWSQPETYARRYRRASVRALYNCYVAAARRVDRAMASSVTHFLTQSPFTAKIIRDAYGRDATLLPPPIDCNLFQPAPTPTKGYFLFVGRLVERYKKPSLVIEAFRRMPDQRLLVAGDGPALGWLREAATPNVEFLGCLGDGELATVMQNCEAAIFPSIDDFGLVPLEVNACGRPVIAMRAGGSAYTVQPGVTGEFLREQSAEAIVDAVRAYRGQRYHSETIRGHALRWDRLKFHRAIRLAAEQLVQGSGTDPTPHPPTPFTPAPRPRRAAASRALA
jgi:glycosyltransferase involved in cell wall biosynthesis